MHMLYLFFVGMKAGRENRPIGITPERWWSACIDVVSGPYTHISVGDPETQLVLSPHQKGTRLYDLSRYALNYPWIICAFEIPLTIPLDISKINNARYSFRQVLWRWLTGGRYNPSDCLGLTIRILRKGGLNPPRMATPRQFHHYLANMGYKHVRFNDDGKDTTSFCTGSDRRYT